MKRFSEMRDNGTVDFGDIHVCDLRYDVIVEIYDKKGYNQLKDEDLLIWTKTEKDVDMDWKMFQDDISYLKDDINISDDFMMDLELENGSLHIYTVYYATGDAIMDIHVVPKFVTN